MSGLEDDAFAALVGLIESTWSGVTAVLREEQTGRANWENRLASGALGPPFVVVMLGPSRPEGWGIDNQAFRLPAAVTLVVSLTDSGAAVSGGSDVTGYLLQQLGQLRAALISYVGSAFQLAGDHPTLDASVKSEANQVLLNLQSPLQAGELSAQLLIGASP
ncbi:MAG TPA: hypothetical protein VKT78_16785 [Fimbriimonadaceae bacterium]|nr:hypothetical protein [Fimbriimonadaceae bacterium]